MNPHRDAGRVLLDPHHFGVEGQPHMRIGGEPRRQRRRHRTLVEMQAEREPGFAGKQPEIEAGERRRRAGAEIGDLLHLQPGAQRAVENAELLEHLQRGRQPGGGALHPAELHALFQHGHRHAELGQAQRRGQTDRAGAGDQNARCALQHSGLAGTHAPD